MPRAPRIASHLAGIPASVCSSLAERLERHAGERWLLQVGGIWQAIVRLPRKGPVALYAFTGEVGSSSPTLQRILSAPERLSAHHLGQ